MELDFKSILVAARTWPLTGRFSYWLLKVLGTEIPLSVKIGKNFQLENGGLGVVINAKTVIGNSVKIYPEVVADRAAIHRGYEESNFEGIIIKDEVILCPGAKVLCSQGLLQIGQGTVIGANSVLVNSTGENEVWAGIPARLVGSREHGVVIAAPIDPPPQ
jgi:serine O-acetyltransferase